MNIEGFPGAQIIVQVEQSSGQFTCAAYGNVATARCAYIVITGDPQQSADLAKAIGDTIAAATRNVQNVPLHCQQPHTGGPIGCSGFADPKCQKLLVLVSDGTTPVALPSFAALWKDHEDYAVLPVLPEGARTKFGALIPPKYATKNAAYWKTSVADVLPNVFAAASITVDAPRLFISYRQKESLALAMQLFDALTHAGFDVFLDRYRVPAAANFQERLTQELGDKSMVLVLESNDILGSQWTREEIDTARACEMTLAALLLPNGKRVAGIADAARMEIADADFVGGAFTPEAILTPARLEQVVAFIEGEHDAGVLWRRDTLRSAIEHELALRGVTLRVDGMGIIHARNATGKEYKIWPSVRSPELNDFHVAHLARTPPGEQGVVVGLSRLFASSTRRRFDWLSNVCSVAMVDKGQIDVAAERIARGETLP